MTRQTYPVLMSTSGDELAARCAVRMSAFGPLGRPTHPARRQILTFRLPAWVREVRKRPTRELVPCVPLRGFGGMANFFAELKRRHIYRVGAAYVVVAWALTQLVEILAQVFTLPLWIAQTADRTPGHRLSRRAVRRLDDRKQATSRPLLRPSGQSRRSWTGRCAVLLAVLIALSGYRLIAPSSDATTPSSGRGRCARSLGITSIRHFPCRASLSRICRTTRARSSSPTA